MWLRVRCYTFFTADTMICHSSNSDINNMTEGRTSDRHRLYDSVWWLIITAIIDVISNLCFCRYDDFCHLLGQRPAAQGPITGGKLQKKKRDRSLQFWKIRFSVTLKERLEDMKGTFKHTLLPAVCGASLARLASQLVLLATRMKKSTVRFVRTEADASLLAFTRQQSI